MGQNSKNVGTRIEDLFVFLPFFDCKIVKNDHRISSDYLE